MKPEGVGYPTLFEYSPEDVVYCGFTIRYRYNQDILFPKFSLYSLKSDAIRKEVLRKSTISANTNINQKSYAKIMIPIPTIPEQQKIAEILSTWDNFIENLENLISKKIETKKGLMQNLLSGNVRFSEFKDGWEEVKLGDILKERTDVGHSNLELLAITMKSGVVKRSELELKDNSSEDKSKYKRILLAILDTIL